MAVYDFGGEFNDTMPTLTREQYERFAAKVRHPVTWKPNHYHSNATPVDSEGLASMSVRANKARALGAQPDSSNRPTTRIK